MDAAPGATTEEEALLLPAGADDDDAVPDATAQELPASNPPVNPWLLGSAWIAAHALYGLLAGFLVNSSLGLLVVMALLPVTFMLLQWLVVWTLLGRHPVLFYWMLTILVSYFGEFAFWLLMGAVDMWTDNSFPDVILAILLFGAPGLMAGLGQAPILADLTNKKGMSWGIWLPAQFVASAAAGVVLLYRFGVPYPAFTPLPTLILVRSFFTYSVITAAPLAVITRHIPART